jgi:hypothetical protein
MASVSSLWLPDEAKIETEQEEDGMDDGAATADLRCFDKTSPQQRHRNIGEIQIEHNARRHEEPHTKPTRTSSSVIVALHKDHAEDTPREKACLLTGAGIAAEYQSSRGYMPVDCGGAAFFCIRSDHGLRWCHASDDPERASVWPGVEQSQTAFGPDSLSARAPHRRDNYSFTPVVGGSLGRISSTTFTNSSNGSAGSVQT